MSDTEEMLIASAARNGKDVSTLRRVTTLIRSHYPDHRQAWQASVQYLITPDYMKRSKV